MQTSPVSFPVHVARLPKRGMPVIVEANEKQREALAEIHDLLSVESFRAELTVTGWKRNGVRVEGRVEASIVQQCVVTLDPVPATISEPVEGVFLPEDSKLGREGFGHGGEILIEVDGPDSPETFSGDTIDVGALSEEFFGLAIDPYPRKAGASSDALPREGADEPEPNELQRKLGALLQRKP